MRSKTPPNGNSRIDRVIPAPAWLARRMENLRRLQPPTLKEVEAQLKASAQLRKKLTERQAV